MFCLPLRLLIVERTLAPAEVIGAGLALLVWTYPAEEFAGARGRRHAGRGDRAAGIVALRIHGAGARHVVDSLLRHAGQPNG